MSVNLLRKVDKRPTMPGTWCRTTSKGPQGRDTDSWGYAILICCPVCARISSVGAIHKVKWRPDGTFSLDSPYECPWAPCKWHVVISHCEWREVNP